MPVRHQLIDTDTVEYLANEYLGDPDRWREIVDYNNLVYPYFSKDPEDKYRVYADGFIRITRSVALQALTLKKHWTVTSHKNILSSTVKTYYLVDDVTLEAGQTEAMAFIRSIVPGLQGNATEGTITELGNDFIRNNIQVEITNDNSISGGAVGFVRVTGEYIFIPTSEDVLELKNYDAKFSYEQLRYFYGDDLQLGDDKDLTIGASGDLGTLNFMKNVEQAINRRFESEIGDVLTDFTFGNRISEIIADNKLPIEAKKRLIEMEILECLGYEDRIENPEVTSIEVVPAELACYVSLSMTAVKIGADLQLSSLYIGGVDDDV